METPKVGRGFLCSVLGEGLCYRRGNLQNGKSRGGNKKTTTKYSFTYKVALPESKSLTDECKGQVWKMLDLPRKEEREKDPAI